MNLGEHIANNLLMEMELLVALVLAEVQLPSIQVLTTALKKM